ncbi:hypothetical protein [Nonomuraea bangladeshensis]|uniref:hypothetical protein n=1 Tax=Nonomuraea bangladeshensis TaxID=404385 RepID=UPI003C30CB40
MSLFILALVIAAVVCGVMWRRPDARAVVSGAWQAGKAQAVREFRDGYTFAQERLRDGNPSWKNPRRWVSWTLSTGYGAAKTLAAANRIRRAAWRGARDRYQAWKAAQPVDAQEVVEQVSVGPDDTQPSASTTQPDQCPPADTAEPRAGQASSDATPDPASDTTPGPEAGPEPTQEGTDMQTEATGLTSYAAAHQQFASELRAQMSGSESLAASMSGILAEHSDLIGDTAVLQDLLNQAAGVADRIASRATEVASN